MTTGVQAQAMAQLAHPSSVSPLAHSPTASTPSRLLVLDCQAGVAGDMLTGALVHLVEELVQEFAKQGASHDDDNWSAILPAWQKALTSLSLTNVSFDVEPTQKCGIGARQFRVGHDEHHPHRGLHDVLTILRAGDLTDGALARATRAFTLLAEAEAAVHDTTVDKVHFHEVGAVDAIIDIASASILLDAIGPARILASAVRTGSGTVKCAHGVMPVPAPATARLLRGIPTFAGDVAKECATPTGAALLLANVDAFEAAPVATALAEGYGAGEMDTPHPNAVRATLITTSTVEAAIDNASTNASANTNALNAIEVEFEEIVSIETHVDDMTGEDFGALTERLLAPGGGAVDVSYVAATGKKGRPMTWIRVLCRPDAETQHPEEQALQTLFKHSTTLGARVRREARAYRPRDNIDVETVFGTIGGKRVRDDDGERFFAEDDDCKRAAIDANVSVSTVRTAAALAFSKALDAAE